MAQSAAGPRPLDELGARTVRKVRNKIMPLVIVLYFIAYLDRNNVGFAKLDMSEDIGLSEAAYGLGAGMFFIGYALFEVPSNGAMHRFGARKWIARILITWGIFATAMALVQGPTSFSVIRFLLGAAEAGFFPAIVLYLTYWFPAAQRVAVLGLFILAQPISNALGAPISGLLLEMDGIGGLAGWQWLYIIEGIPAIILGFVTPFAMTDRPRDAKWLAPEEREWLVRSMDEEDRLKKAGGEHHFMAGLKDKRALSFAALYFGLVFGIYGLGLWMPTIVNEMGDFSYLQVGAIVFVPYAIAALWTFFWTRHSDRTRDRAGHASISMALAAVGLVASGFLLEVNTILALAALTVAAMGIYSAIAPFLEMPASVLAGAAAASGIALVNSLGNLGGFVAPYAVGALNESTGSSRAGLLLLAAALAITSVATFLYARATGAGRPPEDREDLIARAALLAPGVDSAWDEDSPRPNDRR